MRSLLILIFTLSNYAFASSPELELYDLKVDFSLNGDPVFSPEILVKEGEKAMVSHRIGSEDYFIEVVATSFPAKHPPTFIILMQFVVGKISNSGERTMMTNLNLMTTENEPAKVTTNEENGEKDALSLAVVAKRSPRS